MYYILPSVFLLTYIYIYIYICVCPGVLKKNAIISPSKITKCFWKLISSPEFQGQKLLKKCEYSHSFLIDFFSYKYIFN